MTHISIFTSHFFRLRLGLGTFAPFFRASDSPTAIACRLLVTLLPVLPLLSFPLFCLCNADSTYFLAFGPYLAIFYLLWIFYFLKLLVAHFLRLDFLNRAARKRALWL